LGVFSKPKGHVLVLGYTKIVYKSGQHENKLCVEDGNKPLFYFQSLHLAKEPALGRFYIVIMSIHI